MTQPEENYTKVGEWSLPQSVVELLVAEGTLDETREHLAHLVELVDEHGRERAVELGLDEMLDEITEGFYPFEAAILKARMRRKFYELVEEGKGER